MFSFRAGNKQLGSHTELNDQIVNLKRIAPDWDGEYATQATKCSHPWRISPKAAFLLPIKYFRSIA